MKFLTMMTMMDGWCLNDCRPILLPRSYFTVQPLPQDVDKQILNDRVQVDMRKFHHIRLLNIHQRMELTLFHDEITPIPFLDGCQAIEYDIRIAVLTRYKRIAVRPEKNFEDMLKLNGLLIFESWLWQFSVLNLYAKIKIIYF